MTTKKLDEIEAIAITIAIVYYGKKVTKGIYIHKTDEIQSVYKESYKIKTI